MLKSINKILLLLMALALVSPAQAVRYMGNPQDALPINNLINILQVQYQEIDKLLDMLQRLDVWKQKLNTENARLFEEAELAKEDKKKSENGQMSQEELNKKWLTSGRSQKHDRDLKLFKEDVARFNAFARGYNDLTKKLQRVLEKRNPQQVRALASGMRMLVKKLRSALDGGNIEKAKYIAKNSKIAAEFGYVAQ